MKYVKMLVLAAAVGAATAALGSNKKGSNIKNARELKASQAVKLVPEYDYEGDKGERTDDESGVAYYTVKLSKGQAYTIWMTGGNAEELSLNIETDWVYYDKESKEDIEPAADFDIMELDGGSTQVAYLYADDWDEEDPNKGRYVVYIDGGEPGMTTQLYYTKGIRSFDRVGSEDSPKVISFSNKWKTHSGKLIEGEYHLRSSLKAGRKYRVRTLLGTASYPLELNVDDGSSSETDGEESSEWYEDSAFAKVANNDALVVVPETSGKYEFVVTGDSDSQAFRFLYTAVPTRAVTKHPYIPLEAANNYTVSFQPGRMVNSNNYYDDIIDEHLCRIYLEKGQRWVFDTTGASKDLEMIAYNTKGKILARNSTIGNGSKDMRVTITADVTGIYYVGVHDPALDVDGVADAEIITLTARNTATILPPDQWDPADDLYTGATMLTPYPCMTNLNSVEAISLDIDAARNLGSVSERHRFGANDIYDVFAIPCRAGCTYQLRAAFSDENDTTDLTLGATVFYYSSDANYKAGKGTTVSLVTGSISPATELNPNDDLTFTAGVNGTYYVRVWVKTADGSANALGLDFPAYDMYATVRNSYFREEVLDGGATTNEVEVFNSFGLLKGEIDGGVGSWTVAGDARTYPSGAQVALTNASAAVTFAAVSGFNAPASVPVDLDEWTSGSDPVTVVGRYSDIYDAKYVVSSTTKKTKKNGKTITTTTYNYSAEGGDNTPAGAFAITPANKAASLKRTLWSDDPADHFKFTAVAGTYYNFSAASASSNITVVVSNAVTGAVVYGSPLADGTGSELLKQMLEPGLSYLIVQHGDAEEKDACYTLTYSKATPGVVQFAYKYTSKKVKGKTVKTPITVSADDATPLYAVKEGTAYATLSVTRSAAEGALRVKYATEAVTAVPGTNYYPVTDGEISWAAGDKASKSIKIKLLPDLVAQWASSNLTFKVHLFPVDEFDLADNEYLAQTNALATAVVSITEATAKKPGTISVKSYVDGVSDATPVENAKKPVVTGTAGKGGANTLTVAFARTGGENGPVAVKVTTTTAKGNTAKAGVDYVTKSETLTWADGESLDKAFTIELPPVEDYVATKSFTLTIAAAKTDGTVPALAAKTATVTVKNALVDQTAAAYAKAIAATTKLKLASTGTWFKDYDGTLRSGGAAGTLTYTLTGPGFFLCKPSVVTNAEGSTASLFCQFDKEAAVDCMADGFDGTVARVLAAGTHTVKFTLAGAADGEYVKFENQEDGSPYLWEPLTGIAAYDPMTKSVVQTNQTKLVWALPAGIAGRDGIYNRVRFGTTAKTMAVVANVPATVTEIDMPVELAAGGVYFWAVDTAYTKETGLSDEAIAALTYVPVATWTFSVIKDGAPITDVRTTCEDAAGRNIGDLIAAGEAIELIQGVKPDFELVGDGEGEDGISANAFRFVGGALPKGLSVNSAGKLVGAPSTPGEYRAIVQSYSSTTVTKKVNGKKKKVTTVVYGTTMPVNFRVIPAGISIGSFRAALAEDGLTFAEDPRRSGMLSFSATAAGKLTASVTIGGVAYKFTGTGYDEILDRDETATGCTRTFQVKLTNTTKINKKTNTYNYLTLTVRDGALTNGVALAESMGSVELLMQVANPKKTAVVKDVTYKGDLYRNNGTTDLGKEAMADFAGYYTVSLPPEAVTAADGVPVGNGYLLMTVAANSVKVTGVLADGTAVSCSTFGQLVGEDLADARKCALYVPVFAGKTTVYSIAGLVKISYENPAADGALPVVAPSAKLIWAKPAAAANSRDGSGFALSLAPTGGWYDKVVNLQAYYRDREFAAYGAGSGDDLPEEALAKGYSFTDQSTVQDLAVNLTGNAFSVAARKLVKNKTTGMYDFASSVNPWAATVKFTRATGVVTGTMNAWEWVFKQDAAEQPYTFATAQKEIKKLTHKGVLLFSRDSSSESPLATDTLTSGFFMMPATKKWKASLPFTIRTTDDTEKVWNELDFGAGDGDGGE